jgi:succinylglutamate desuccinylase
VLELTPTAKSDLSLLLSTGIHGNETAPVEIVDLLLRALYRNEIALKCRVLVVLGNPPALAQNKRYLVSDINRMFGGRWSQFPQSDETARAAWLENVVTAFFAAAGPCAGIWICIRRSARLTMFASAFCRSAISRGMKRS